MNIRKLKSNLQRKVENLYKEYRAILILTNSLTSDKREKVDETLKQIPSWSRKVLQNRKGQFQDKAKELIDYYGVHASLKELEDLVDTKNLQDGASSRKYLLLSKYHLQQIFTRYERAYPKFNCLSPHARIAIDVLGIRTDRSHREVFQLEMSIFFDMAILWNSSLELSHNNSVDPVKVKHLNALQRSTVKAAFNLIEGYLNGLALDINLTQKMTSKEKMKLSEWDESKSRPKLLSLRDKFLQYPKIVLKAEHPPISETNCPEMMSILELEQNLRHALIHPKPMVIKTKPEESREEYYFNLDINQVAKICDLVIEAIFKISDIIGNRFGDPSFWLYRRDTSGRFPEKIFK